MNNDTPEIEVWKPVVGYEGYYEVSNLGRVKRVNRKVLKPSNTKGYCHVNLLKCGKLKGGKIHRLVAFAFLGDPPTAKHEVNHKNGIKTDNRLENLEWVTHSENMRHALEMGLKGGLISTEKRNEILLLLNQKPRLEMAQIAEMCHVGIHVVESVRGKDTVRWTRIQNDDIEEIKHLLNEGKMMQKEIASKFNVDAAVISRIKKGTYYGRIVLKRKKLF